MRASFLSLALAALPLVGCGSAWKTLDLDGDGVTAEEGDCWDSPEGPPGSGLKGDQISPDAEETWYDGTDQNCDGLDDDDADQDGSAAVIAGGADCDDADPAVHPGAEEVWYDGADQDCDGASDDDQDQDGADSAAEGGEDCDDLDPAVGPHADEVWYDGVDQNCDGADDYDQDQDGHADPSGGGDDCDDTDPTAYPGAVEIWYDGVDGDCAGDPDDDQDGDDHPAASAGGDDCDDTNEEVYPDAPEFCNDTDDNCNGETDEGYLALDASSYYQDSDGDGYGDASEVEPACDGHVPPGLVLDDSDCDDSDPLTWPGATEIVGDEVDQSCNGREACYTDADADGYRSTDTVGSADADCDDEGEAPDSLSSGDCDDSDSTAHPGATEVWYDGTDTDCAGDDDYDQDHDGYSAAAYGVGTADDCVDTDDAIHPGATELCGTAADDDCDGDDNDEGAVDCEDHYLDADADGYGAGAATCTCVASSSAWITTDGDCDDGDDAISPGASETVGDDVDADCDGRESCYTDADDDGYREPTGATVGSIDADCADTGEATASDPATDCDDRDASRSPAATETVGDGVDQTCDGQETCYLDADDDGYRGAAGATVASADSDCADSAEALASDPGDDCDDSAAAVSPGAAEICDAADTDDDCDGVADDLDSSVSSAGKTSFYADADADGYGDAAASVARCDQPSGYAANSDDCDDTTDAISPADREICDAADADEDCDGRADDADGSLLGSTRTIWYDDDDGDGYGDASDTTKKCDLPAGYADNDDDCDDSDGDIHPAATEQCDAANTDEDCDGLSDDQDPSVSPAGATTYYDDDDSDGYGDPTDTVARCDLSPGASADDRDCDDTRAAIHPGAAEVCDSVDDDCSGSPFDLDDDGSAFSVAGLGLYGLSSEDLLVFLDADDLDLGVDDFTLELWIYADTFSGVDGGSTDPSVRLLDKSGVDPTSSATWSLSLQDDGGYGYPRLSLSGLDADGAVVDASVDSADGLEQATWTHLAVVVDRASNQLTWYLDGVAYDTLALTPAFLGAEVDNSAPLTVSSTYNSFDGTLDEVRIWSVARSADEIAGGRCRKIDTSDSDYGSLRIYLPFERSTSDEGPYGFAAALSGTAALTLY